MGGVLNEQYYTGQKPNYVHGAVVVLALGTRKNKSRGRKSSKHLRTSSSLHCQIAVGSSTCTARASQGERRQKKSDKIS